MLTFSVTAVKKVVKIVVCVPLEICLAYEDRITSKDSTILKRSIYKAQLGFTHCQLTVNQHWSKLN